MNRPSFCQNCPISHVTEGYTPLDLKPGTTLVVGEASGQEEALAGKGFVGGSGRMLQGMLRHAGQPWDKVSTLNVIGCHPPSNVFPSSSAWTATSRDDGRAAVAYCAKHHMWPGVRRARKQKVYAVGAQALHQLTGKTGIMTWRGSSLPKLGESTQSVIPVIHPAALMRSPKMTSVTVGDMKRPLALPPENYNLFPSMADVQRFKSRSFAFDFEWDRNGITICGLSDRFYGAIVVPWVEPYLSELQRIFESATSLIGHNIIGADIAWLDKMGWHITARIEDTMLKQHLCQPDYPHGLDFVASVFTQKNFWKGHGWEEMDEEHEGDETPGQQWRTWDRADALPRALGGYGGCLTAKEAFALYNARDTDAEFQINTPLDGMLRKWELYDLYYNVSRPAAYICRWVADPGLRIDPSRLAIIRTEVDTRINQLESALPEGLAPYEETVGCNLPAPEGMYRPKEKTCKGTRKEPHGERVVTFTNPTDSYRCDECNKELTPGKMTLAKVIKGTRQDRVVPYNSAQGVQRYVDNLKLKTIINRKTGNATTGKSARGVWAQSHPEFAILGELKKNTTLRNNFAKDSLLGLDRMFFNLKVHGTAEGRLSASGRRRGIDLNPQNQPEAFRSIYVPEHPDWGFVNIDISQGESWLTCWLAKDWARWEKLQDPNYDEHSELASSIFNRPINKQLISGDKALNALRQIGKKTNHASAYGMGWKKFHEILITDGYTQYTAADAKEFIEAWRRLNPGTVAWQKETIALMQRQGYLRNPFGRVRWFSSRESVNQALAFLPASTLADCVLRMMIAHYPGTFQAEIEANHTAVYHELAEDWRLSCQVHDSLLFQGPWKSRQEQIERSSQIMVQPFSELDNFAFRVDVKTSQSSWGEC